LNRRCYALRGVVLFLAPVHPAIRPATLDDIPRLQELEQVFPNSMPETMLRRELEVGWGLVCVEAGVVQGYALVREDDGMLDLTRLAVNQEAQGQGIGGELLRAVLEHGKTTVLTVLKDNARAVALYQRHGFRIVGHFRAERAWSMRRDAAAAAQASCPAPC
jgi:ribosomal protein S18 acetylase RimI-like enzyme